MTSGAPRLHLRLPATSANLGPGFDALALALDLFLEVVAVPADGFSIEATGRGVAICSALEGNLLLETYKQTWRQHGSGEPAPLHLIVHNGIPLGMGCGSSAASRLAGIALASHFGQLGWDRMRMLQEASALEHHPDNAAACCLGGLVAANYAHLSGETTSSSTTADDHNAMRVQAISIKPPADWCALLVLPEQPLATTASRAVLPESYTRSDVVQNLQNVAVLVAAFASGDAGMLRAATADRLHQPFRGTVCPLLPRLLPLAGSAGILSVTLSGAGAGILLLLASEAAQEAASALVLDAANDPAHGTLPVAELLLSRLCRDGATLLPQA